MTEQLANPIAPLWTMLAIIVAVVIAACVAEWFAERQDPTTEARRARDERLARETCGRDC